MSLSLILSEYSRSLLTDELPLVVLAVLERGGLIMTDEIDKQVNVDREKLNSVLIDLHRNRCIVFGRHHVRVSERGKALVDSFNLQGAIVDDLVGCLPVSKIDRPSYHRLLLRYRDDAFVTYLNSVGTIRTWRSLVSLVSKVDRPTEDSSERAELRQREAYLSLAFLLADLRNWASHSALEQDVTSEISGVEKAAVEGASQIKFGTKWKSRFDAIFSSILYTSEEDQSHFFKRGGSLASSAHVLNTFRHRHSSDVWFDGWHDAMRQLPEPKKETDFLKQLRMFYTEACEGESGAGEPYTWRTAGTQAEHITDFLTRLLLADSLTDLGASTGMSQESLTTLIARIQHKFGNLLTAAARTSVGGGVREIGPKPS